MTITVNCDRAIEPDFNNKQISLKDKYTNVSYAY